MTFTSFARSAQQPFYCTYVCADDRPFYLVATSHFKHQERCLQTLGLQTAAAALGILPSDDVEPAVAAAETRRRQYGEDDRAAHCGLASNPFDPTTWAVLRPLMRAAFRTRSASQWEKAFDAARVPGAAHLTTDEWARSDHAVDSGLIIIQPPIPSPPSDKDQVEEDIKGREGGRSEEEKQKAVQRTKDPSPPRWERRPGPIAWCRTYTALASSSSPPTENIPTAGASRVVSPPLPRQGEDTSSGGWLDGLKVLDACNVIAGPTVASVLSRFGAEVLKLDHALPTYVPEVTVLYGEHTCYCCFCTTHLRIRVEALATIRFTTRTRTK